MVTAWQEGGATRVDLLRSLEEFPADLSAYRVVALAVPIGGIPDDVEEALLQFHARGGGLVLLGEQARAFETSNEALNGLLTALGTPGEIQFLAESAGSGGCHTTDVDSDHDLMTGVSSIKWALSGVLSAPPTSVLFNSPEA